MLFMATSLLWLTHFPFVQNPIGNASPCVGAANGFCIEQSLANGVTKRRDNDATRKEPRARGPRMPPAGVPSKSEILTQALNALQEQFNKIGSGAASAGTKLPTAKPPSKEKRAQGHRATRAEVRSSLEEKRSTLSAASDSASTTKKKVAKKKIAKKKSEASDSKAPKKSVEAAVKKTSHQQAAKKTTTKKRVASKKKVTAKKKASVTSANTQTDSSKPKRDAANNPTARYNVNPSDQRASKTKAKNARIQQSGLTTRTRGHVSARGKRAQGRRDSSG